MAKKSKRHYSIERYLGMEIPKCFLDEVCEATTVYKNCDRSTLERECARMFAYIKVMEAYIEELELKLGKTIDIRKEIIEKACNWMRQQTYQEFAGAPFERLISDDLIDDFVKSMEE